jgi:glutamine amidotransferase
MIAIVDYGAGNLRNVQKGFERGGAEARVTDDPEAIRQAAGVVLPGVGAFRDCYDGIVARGLTDVVLESIRTGKPFLGICVGLQLLFTESEEGGLNPGFDIIRGSVRRFPTSHERKVPHMGWNQIEIVRPDCPLFDGVESGDFVYFVHSYYVTPSEENVIASVTEYGVNFCSAIWKENLFGVQFHPEKSQQLGLRILNNFARIVRNARQNTV